MEPVLTKSRTMPNKRAKQQFAQCTTNKLTVFLTNATN